MTDSYLNPDLKSDPHKYEGKETGGVLSRHYFPRMQKESMLEKDQRPVAKTNSKNKKKARFKLKNIRTRVKGNGIFLFNSFLILIEQLLILSVSRQLY